MLFTHFMLSEKKLLKVEKLTDGQIRSIVISLLPSQVSLLIILPIRKVYYRFRSMALNWSTSPLFRALVHFTKLIIATFSSRRVFDS